MFIASLTMPLAHLWILTLRAVKNILYFVTGVSIFFDGWCMHWDALTGLIVSLLCIGIHVSLEYTGRSALIHIYGSIFWVGTSFLVSTDLHII